MRIVFFCHSLLSDWNHGNAHFLRGITAELGARGHEVTVFEPADGWSRANLVSNEGEGALAEAAAAFSHLKSETYDPVTSDPARLTEGADLVIVHEWNDRSLVAAVGQERAWGGYRALFHDTHHRSVTRPDDMARYDLSGYDGVLAFGAVIRDVYLDRGWAARAWTWHEAADTRVFRPLAPADAIERDGLVWIGNWGDEERTKELREYLIDPVRRLGLPATVHGVRYPEAALTLLASAGVAFGGYLPNHAVPGVFARHQVTVHIPRRPYATNLPGIPTIRPFEALACGIPLVSAPWDDAEHLFRDGRDFLMARDGKEMERHIDDVLNDSELAHSLAASGLETITTRHSCAHRADELMAICAEIGVTGG